MLRFDLSEKVAVVTGAASGIGSATAVELRALGANLALVDLNRKGLEITLNKLDKREACCDCYEGDVSEPAFVSTVISKVQMKHGRIDILVNAAGIWEAVPFLEIKTSSLQKMMNVNFVGGFNFIKGVLPYMVEQKYGKIISVASIAGKAGSGIGASHYAASKGALLALTYSVAKEFGAYGININAVAPGLIDTPIGQRAGDRAVQEYAKGSALKRIGKPEEVASVIAFLASDLSTFVTGQAWNVCGGYLR